MTKNSDDVRFAAELKVLTPHVRRFAMSLCRDRSVAEDLAQETLLKAWRYRTRFTLGTNLKAWLNLILKNDFYGLKRRDWRTQALEEQHQRTLAAITSENARLELNELRHCLGLLTKELREAVLLVGAGGLSYQEAAGLCHVPLGTMKSRVSRARARLGEVFDRGAPAQDSHPPHEAMFRIQKECDQFHVASAP